MTFTVTGEGSGGRDDGSTLSILLPSRVPACPTPAPVSPAAAAPEKLKSDPSLNFGVSGFFDSVLSVLCQRVSRKPFSNASSSVVVAVVAVVVRFFSNEWSGRGTTNETAEKESGRSDLQCRR